MDILYLSYNKTYVITCLFEIMKKVIYFMRSESFIFISVLCVLTGQILHTVYLFEGLRRIDLSFTANGYETPVLNWIHAFLCASAVEAAILMFLINGKKIAAQIYALASFATNILYYHYWNGSIPEIISSTIISGMLSGSIWFFSDLFAEKIQLALEEEEKQNEFLEGEEKKFDDHILPISLRNTKDYVGKKGL